MPESVTRIALFGGSGATGQEVVASALERGWQVSGLVRRAGTLSRNTSAVREIVGSLESRDAVRETTAGSDAIVIALGARPPYQEVFCSSATRTIIEAARASRVEHLVCLTGALVGDYPDNQGSLFRLMADLFGGRASPSMRDRMEQEQVVRQSGLRWTLVKPPRLTLGPRRGRVRSGEDVRVGLMSAISRKDLADVILDLCCDAGAVGSALFVKSA